MTACGSSPKVVTERGSVTTTTSVSDKPCGGDTKPIHTVRNQAGTIRFDAEEKQYRIVVTLPNTIDSQDVGILCQLPDPLKVDGLAVTFDGDYRPYDRTPKVMLGGQSFYYLTVTKLTSEKGSF